MFNKSRILIVSVVLVILVIVSVIGAPLLCSLFAKNSDPFSELWILGPEHTAENYPYNITNNQEYAIYLGVGNQLNQDSTYSIRVKLCTNLQQLPNSTTAEPSPLVSSKIIDFSLHDEEIWEIKLIFSLEYQLNDQNISQIENIVINGDIIPINYNSIWDSTQNRHSSILLFELWYYDESVSDFQYTNQNVRINLNLI